MSTISAQELAARRETPKGSSAHPPRRGSFTRLALVVFGFMGLLASIGELIKALISNPDGSASDSSAVYKWAGLAAIFLLHLTLTLRSLIAANKKGKV
jgi:hypothetical protein